jgi:hypothetical protein
MRTTKTIIGIVLLVIGELALILTARDLFLLLKFGGTSLIGAYNFGTMIFDGAVAIVFGGIGILLTRDHLKRTKPRTVLIVISVIAILLGLNAGRVMTS